MTDYTIARHLRAVPCPIPLGESLVTEYFFWTLNADMVELERIGRPVTRKSGNNKTITKTNRLGKRKGKHVSDNMMVEKWDRPVHGHAIIFSSHCHDGYEIGRQPLSQPRTGLQHILTTVSWTALMFFSCFDLAREAGLVWSVPFFFSPLQ